MMSLYWVCHAFWLHPLVTTAATPSDNGGPILQGENQPSLIPIHLIGVVNSSPRLWGGARGPDMVEESPAYA